MGELVHFIFIIFNVNSEFVNPFEDDDYLLATNVLSSLVHHRESSPSMSYNRRSFENTPLLSNTRVYIRAPAWHCVQHNTHTPLESPPEFMYPTTLKPTDTNRMTYNAMARCLDEGVGNVTGALRDAGMWSSTLVIWYACASILLARQYSPAACLYFLSCATLPRSFFHSFFFSPSHPPA